MRVERRTGRWLTTEAHRTSRGGDHTDRRLYIAADLTAHIVGQRCTLQLVGRMLQQQRGEFEHRTRDERIDVVGHHQTVDLALDLIEQINRDATLVDLT